MAQVTTPLGGQEWVMLERSEDPPTQNAEELARMQELMRRTTEQFQQQIATLQQQISTLTEEKKTLVEEKQALIAENLSLRERTPKPSNFKKFLFGDS